MSPAVPVAGVTHVLDGEAVAADLRADLEPAVERLAAADHRPTLATVLMSTDPASETYVSMKRRACEEVGIESVHRDVDPAAGADALRATVRELNDDPAVDGILVQLPVPEGVDRSVAVRTVDPEKDVDGFHPENVGRLVAGDPRFRPCTPHGIQRLLAAADVDTEGADITVVGRSQIVGRPLANLLLARAEDGNATVTVCHSRTRDLAEKTRRADVLVVAAGRPEFVDREMVGEGAVVIDVGVNRVDADTERGYELVGDVDFEAVEGHAGVLTPVPGGVGPMTVAMLLYNATLAASRRSGVDVELS
jgi:methylenetetrahydrofolate dehydrogenase (NADP+)/methenyltetrahydrofolate cyclohydrolase